MAFGSRRRSPTGLGRTGRDGGDIRANYPAEAGTFAGREFTRENASHCQERTIVVRRITGSGLSVRRLKGREILLGDPHEGAQAVGAQRAGLPVNHRRGRSRGLTPSEPSPTAP